MEKGYENVFSVRVKVLLEGVEIPYSSVSVSYGLNGTPTCTIALQAHSALRSLPEDTKILILYQEPGSLPNSTWYVLFDGELSGMNYSIESSGATLILSGDHATGMLNIMQLITQPMASISNIPSNNDVLAGAPSVFTVNNMSIMNLTLAEILFDKTKGLKSKIKAMSDLVFSIIHSLLSSNLSEGDDAVASTKFYKEKIVDTYKIPDRIANVNIKEDTVKSVVSQFPISLK